jgi:hypothetical protein
VPALTIRRQVAICVTALALGGAALAVPAGGEGRVLVPISDGHGLSAIDAAGALLLAVAGTWLEVLVIRGLPRLRLPSRAVFGLGLLAGLGLGLLVASVFGGFFWWWAVGAASFTGALAVLVALLLRP